MNDRAELEQKRLERFLSGNAGSGKKAPAGSLKTSNGTGKAPIPAAAVAAPASSLGSSPSYKHEEKRKWEVKQERDRAQFGASSPSSSKKHLEMEDSAAELAARQKAAGTPVNVESYEERERRRRAEWKRQASPSLALLEIIEGVADDDSAPTSAKKAPTAAAVKVSSSSAKGRSTSEEAALKELLNLDNRASAGAAVKQTTTSKSHSSTPSASSSITNGSATKLSPRLDDKEQTADTFAQIGDVLNSLNDLLEDNKHDYGGGYHGQPVGGRAGTAGAVDALYVSDLPTHAASSAYPAVASERGNAHRRASAPNAKPATKEARRLAKEARRPQWAQTLYEEFDEEQDGEQKDYQYVDPQLWKVDLEQEERESQEFVKDAQDGIHKLEAVNAMIEPEMDVDDFDEERFSLGIKEFVYSGKKTIRFLKRKSKQGVRLAHVSAHSLTSLRLTCACDVGCMQSVRMAGEAKKFMDDSVALMDTARDYKAARTGTHLCPRRSHFCPARSYMRSCCHMRSHDTHETEKAKSKFSRTIRKVKEGAQKLTKTVANAIDDEVERMRELREKVRAADRDRREREEREAEERESRQASSEREANVTRLSFEIDQVIFKVKKIEDDAFRFDYNSAVDLLKTVRDAKDSVPVLLAYLKGDIANQFSHLNAEITEVSTATARFVKDWQVTHHTQHDPHDTRVY
jgi:hypothetical protein